MRSGGFIALSENREANAVNMIRLTAAVSALILCPAAFSQSAANEAALSYAPYQQTVLNEVNFARTDPSGYALNRLAAEYAAGKDNGAYMQLMKMKPVKALELEPRLTKAADEYAKYLAAKNRFGHNERGTPSSRMSGAGYSGSALGENIACGSYPGMDADERPTDAAVIFVKQWLIDEGVPGTGHRKNILSPLFSQTGIGFGRNPKSSYVNYMVQDFGSPR